MSILRVLDKEACHGIVLSKLSCAVIACKDSLSLNRVGVVNDKF